MLLGKRLRSTLTWVICLMLLVGSFASSLRVKVGADFALSDWVEVCTASGMKLVSLSNDKGSPAPTDEQPHHLSGHCAWCAAHSVAMGMPPSPLLHWYAPVTGRVLPILFLEAPAPLFAWASAQPRAPPISA